MISSVAKDKFKIQRPTLFLSLSMTLLKIAVAITVLTFVLGCSMYPELDLPAGEWRNELDVPIPPHDWRKLQPFGQPSIVWHDPGNEISAGFSGYGQKEIQLLPDGTIIEKDTYYAGHKVKHPDPDGGMVEHTLDLIYYVRDGVLIEKKGFDTLKGFLSYDEAIKQRDQWLAELKAEE